MIDITSVSKVTNFNRLSEARSIIGGSGPSNVSDGFREELDTFLTDMFGVEPTEYEMQIGRMLLTKVRDVFNEMEDIIDDNIDTLRHIIGIEQSIIDTRIKTVNDLSDTMTRISCCLILVEARIKLYEFDRKK